MTIPAKMLASGMSEAEAIEGAKQGDVECFQSLYTLHKRHVYSLCLRMIGNVETAEDLTQDVFLLLYRKIATLRVDSTFHLWLQRLTVNVVLMHLRREQPTMISLDQTLESGDEAGNHKEFAVQDQKLAGSIDRVVLERAIEDLSPGCRTMFVLHDIQGYDHSEIAEMLGCCTGNSKSQLHKARLKLRAALCVTRAENARHQTMKVQHHVVMTTGRGKSAAAAA